jgi:dihydroorotase
MAGILEFPGFVDVHVHFREPGMERAETVRTGAEAARRGGFAAVVTMPNTSPAGDSEAYLRNQIEARDLPVRIYPSACITKGRLGVEVAELERLADAGAAFFTDDGSYVADGKVMEEAMRRIANLGMVACQHALKANGGVIRDCALARSLRLPVVPVSAETDAIRRDIAICRVTGCRLHIQHISTAEGVSLVRDAQREGLPVTAEATPHHLLFAADELTADDANYKMAPPLGNREDRCELRRAVKEGAIMFATDHAPHPAEFKSKGFLASANGITGLEAAIGATYRAMVEEEGMPVEDWAKAWWEMPRAIVRGNFDGLGNTRVAVGETRRFDAEASASLSRNSPYGGMEFSCWPAV